jgi:hypothetical protein
LGHFEGSGSEGCWSFPVKIRQWLSFRASKNKRNQIYHSNPWHLSRMASIT